ncbi:MAG: hypothetical protein RIR34_854 [Actinomycetota bacterium]|jgi:hypothetical protein
MLNALTKRFGEGRTALILPLAGYVVLWVTVIGGSFANIFEPQPKSNFDGVTRFPQVVHMSIYLFLVGLAVLGITSVYARRLAVNAAQTRLTKSAGGFALVSVAITLIAGAIYGISSLMMGINSVNPTDNNNEVVRIFNVYVPIVLDAALLVFVILKAFVGLHKDGEDD